MQPTQSAPSSKIVVFASDYKPMDGGVSEFSHQIASFLHAQGSLAWVLSVVPQAKVEGSLPIKSYRTAMGGWRMAGDMWGDQFKWIAKLNTLRFHAGILKSYVRTARLAIGPDVSLILFTFVNSKYAFHLIDKCRTAGKPFALLFHGQDLIRMVEDGRKDWLIKSMASAKQVIYNSRATRDLAKVLLGSSGERNHILYPGLNFDAIESKIPAFTKPYHEPRASIESSTIVMSTVCRLVRRKGIHLVIEALRTVHDRRPDLRFEYHIAGKGPEEEALRSMVSESPELDIHFLGFVSETEKWRLLQESELFVMPNLAMDHSDFEGFGISFVEASFAKNWVIGSSHGGAVEAIEDEVTGWNINADSRDAVTRIADALIHYAEQKQYYSQLAGQASEIVRKRFDFCDLGQAWLAALDKREANK